MKVPDFICIGAQRAGTTWLFEQIRNHPDVFMRTKELDYFVSDRNLESYSQQFSGLAGRLCGDMSPNYGAKVGLARRIHDLCPSAQIVYLLRDPVARAFSQWKMARRLGNIPADVPFSRAFAEDMRRVRTKGEYFNFIREYTQYYPLGSRFKILWFDDIKKRPHDAIREFLAHIGANSQWIAPGEAKATNESTDRQTMPDEDYEITREYYSGPDRELRKVLNLRQLPWE